MTVVVAILLVAALAITAMASPPPGGSFVDDDGSVHEGAIEAIAAQGISRGCNPPTDNRYCPEDPVTRAQMATFMVKALDLPSTSVDAFDDDGGSVHESDIDRLAVAGIARGCNPPDNTEYCPDDPVTRGEMAAFLVRAFEYELSGGDRFVDDDGSVFESDIDRLGSAGITKGCDPPNNRRFCPEQFVLRDQMAAFLMRALELSPLDLPPGYTYYVHSDGDDSHSGTSADQAWRTFDRALAELRPGDRLLLGRGSEWTESLEMAGSGTSSLPIVIGAYGEGPRPVISGSSTCVEMSGSHIHFHDVAVRDCEWAGIRVDGTGNRIEANVITGNGVGIFVREDARDTTIFDNDIVDNDRMSVLTEDPGNDDSGAFGILVHGDGTEISNNRISGSDAFSHDYGRDGAAIEIFGGRDTFIHHNEAVDNQAFIEMGNDRSRNTVVAFNRVRSSLETSVFITTRGDDHRLGPVKGTRVAHNSVLLTGESSQGFVCGAGCGPDILSLANNVIQAGWKVGYADGDFDEDHNLFFGGEAQFDLGPNSAIADPRWADRNDLVLAADSPAIDAGTEVPGPSLDRPVAIDGDGDGTARPDIGAIEHRP